MNRDDIIRWAREAGMDGRDGCWTTDDDPDCLYPEAVYTRNLERFAALVTAAEREACAKVCEELRDDWLRGLGRYEFMGEGADYCADAIRAMGQA